MMCFLLETCCGGVGTVVNMVAQLAGRDTRGALPHRRIAVPGRAMNVRVDRTAGTLKPAARPDA
jgi:hypothetical protein